MLDLGLGGLGRLGGLSPGKGVPVPPAGYRFMTETISGVTYYLTETIGGVTYYWTEAA